MSSILFYSSIFLSVITILSSFFLYRPSYGVIEIEEDGYWRNEELSKDDDTIYSFKIKMDENRIKTFQSKLDEEQLLNHDETEYNTHLSRLKDVLISFDWKQHENFLNTFKQYKTEIEGLNVHFARISTPLNGRNKRLVPILMLHGFPGSFWDFFKVIPILSNPSRHGFDFGVTETIQFDVIIPSLPGFIFSEKPHISNEFDIIAITRILSKLMKRLNIENYFIHGCQGLGSDVASLLASLYPRNVMGLHLSNPFVPPTFSTYTFGRYLLEDFSKTSIDERKTTMIHEYFKSHVFIKDANYHALGNALQNSPISSALYLEQQWKKLSTKLGNINLNLLLTLDEISTEIYLYFITDSWPSSLKILHKTYNEDTKWMNSQVSVPTAITYSENSPWYCSENILADKYLNITRISTISKGGLWHSLQDPNKYAEDIFSFVELQLM